MIVPSTIGLELNEDKLRLEPGSLQECLNYEIAYRKGYSWMEGMLRWDGQAILDDKSAYRALVSKAPGGPAYGLKHFTDRANDQSWLYAVVESVRVSLGTRPIPAENLAVQGQRVEIYSDTPSGFPNGWVLEANASFAGQTQDLIELLIGPDLDVFAGDMVAYTRVDLTNGELEPVPGDQITDPQSGWTATVRGVTVISGAANTLDLVADVWVEIDTAAQIGANAIIERVSDGVTVGLAANVVGYSENGVLAGTGLSVISDIGETVNRGVLIRSTGQGWETIEQAYEVAFKNGQNAPSDVYSNGGQIAENETPGALPSASADTAYWDEAGGADWDKDDAAMRDAIQSDDASFVEATLNTAGELTEHIRVADFTDSLDPLDEPTGVTIQVICERVSGTMDITVDEVASDSGAKRGAGTVVDTKSTLTFGGEFDTWGASSVNELRDNITNAAYEWLVRFAAAGADAATVVRVYMVRRIVHLREGSLESVVYLRAGGTDYQARAIYTHVNPGGSFAGNDAAGVLTLARVDNPALIPSTATVYTQPGGAGDVVCDLDGALAPIRLPSRDRMKLKKSQFTWLETNFFAAGRLAAVYGASGADFAFTFNNNYLLKIRTGRTEDEPRHVSRHKDRLVLGYENGDADLSVATEPVLFDGVLGAFSVGFGRRITGMLPLDGETLGVWTETSIFGIQGATSADSIQQVIADKTGALEYTVHNIGGMPIFTDFRGVSTLAASDRYGDFDSGRLSRPVRPWLLPRLQADASSGIRPILAEAVRKKSQYRLWFEDGYVLTLTYLEDQVPRWTMQKPWLTSDEAPLKVIAVASGVDEDNEALSFASFEESNYVYRIHYGADFDGELIRGRIVYNPVHANGPGRNLRVTTVHIHGISEGLVQLKTQMGVDYALPSGYNGTTNFGAATLNEQRPVFAKTRHKARGRDFSLAIEAQDVTPHTIQVLEFPTLSQRRLER